MSNIEKQFLSQLRKKKLLALKSDSALSSGGVEGEELLLEKWQKVAENFIYRGRKVKIGMKADRQYHGESFCYPVLEVE